MRCKALKPTSESRLQDFLGTLQSLGGGHREARKALEPREARKALEPTSYPRLQDFLDALQSFEAYLRVQATGFSGYVAKLGWGSPGGPQSLGAPGGPQSFGAYIISQATGFLRCAAKL